MSEERITLVFEPGVQGDYIILFTAEVVDSVVTRCSAEGRKNNEADAEIEG